MSAQPLDQRPSNAEVLASADDRSSRFEATIAEREAAREHLRSLARALARQAARRHMHRGYSLYEIALGLALGALAVAALWYGGILHLSGSR